MIDQGVYSFTNLKINFDFLNEVWAFDPKTMEGKDTVLISQYIIALSQYLIYFTFEKNKNKAEIHKLTRYIDNVIGISMTPTFIKKYATKTEARVAFISESADLSMANDKLSLCKYEDDSLENIDKGISELIAALKRELTRRDNELSVVKYERRN